MRIMQSALHMHIKPTGYGNQAYRRLKCICIWISTRWQHVPNAVAFWLHILHHTVLLARAYSPNDLSIRRQLSHN